MLAAMTDTEPTRAGMLGEIRHHLWHRFSGRYTALDPPARTGDVGVRSMAPVDAVAGVEWSGGSR
jgi:hypothetical protein